MEDHAQVGGVRVELYTGSRDELRPLFEMAEDSPTQLESYLGLGRVLVALSSGEVIGHLQLVNTHRPGEVEIKTWRSRRVTGVGGLAAGWYRQP